MDALGAEAAGQPIESVAQRVDAVLHARAEVFPGVGAGDDYRFGGTGVRGAALLVDGVVAHLMAFPA
jgi:hypothetical protein